MRLLLQMCAAACVISAVANARPIEIETHSASDSEIGVARSAFEPTGDVFVTTAFVHVTFQVNVSIFDQYCTAVRQTIDKGLRLGSFDENDAALLKAEVDDACDGVFVWSDAGAVPGARTKRQIVAALGIAAGTLFGAFSLEKMQNLDARLRDLSNEVGDVIDDNLKELHVVQQQQTRIGVIEEDVVRLNSSMTNFLMAYASDQKRTRSEAVNRAVQRDVQRFGRYSLCLQRGMQALHSHRLSVDLVRTEQAERVWPAVLNKVQTMGGVAFPFQHATVLYQLPVSFVMREGVVRVFVHVPVIKRKLEFFQHRSTPIVLKEGSETVIMELDGEEPGAMLAVDRDNTVFAVLSPPEVDDCIRVDRAFFCAIKVLRRDFHKSCIAALFVNSHEGIRRHCTPRISDRTAFAFRLKDTAHLYSMEVTSIAIKCSNGSRRSMSLQGHRQVRIEDGCQLSGPEFVIDGGARDAEVDGGDVVHRIELPAEAWCDGATVTEVAQAQSVLRGVEIHPAPKVAALMQQLREHQRHHQHGGVHLAQHAVVTVIGLAVCGALAWLGWRYCTSAGRRRRLFEALRAHVESALAENDEKGEENDKEKDKE